ncbi:suppressor of glycerol defect [Emydomyces testavorans]|uniref:Suppressor of glycerol defect n=1 Tax=Emydomyces testavorans TaxID=2070801 RepID=A0AAF0DMK0_9EURO|nr:suppressor of glycerol defect [Emydomyces testavorans]
MRRTLHNTTQLPRQLRDELGLEDTYKAGRKNARDRDSTKALPGKKRRKLEQSHSKPLQKQRKGREQSRRRRDRDVFEEDECDDRESGGPCEGHPAKATASKTAKLDKPKSILKKRQPVIESEVEEFEGSELGINLDESEEEEESFEAGQPSSRHMIPRAVQERLAEDDAEIIALEKKLGLKGKKKLSKEFLEDGLDDLLGDLGSDSETTAKKRKREGHEWLQKKRQKAQMDVESSEEQSTDSEDTDEGDSDNENSAFEGFDDEEEKPDLQKSKQRENPYRPPVAASHAALTKYIPPSRRIQSSTESESLTRLRRQAQGYLNKLSEANMVSILGDIERLYQDYPRQIVTSMLIDLLFGLVCSGSNLNDTFVILHAAFVAAVYKVIGMEFGAEFIQNIVERLDKMYDEKVHDEPNRKDMANLISLLSHLYNFHVIGCGLVFDYIRVFLKEINELNTELLLKVVRNSGPQLRQDDPSALKDIVLLIQPAVAQIGEAALSVRTKFMIEMITDLKNNRFRNAPGASISSEHITKMRKTLGSLNTRNLRASEPLRIGRADIHDSEKKGKWWLVGASWKAGPAVDSTVQKTNANPNAILPDTLDDDLGDGKAVDLGQLARTHRMNTEVRRSIFVAIMSASDYQDAHVRLTKLRLKRNQETEIPHVLIHCASEEETYNPYYTLIARKLCGERRMKVAFQFPLWDVFKRLGERGNLDDDDYYSADEEDRVLSTRNIVNLAKLYGSLIADGGLTLGILKTLDFLYLQPRTKSFVELLLITIMQQTQQKALRKQQKARGFEDGGFDEKKLVDVFLKLQDAPQVVPGLIYFIRKAFAKSGVLTLKQDKKLLKWGCRLALDTLKMISEAADS